MALNFEIKNHYNETARASLLTLPHGRVRTPAFMPVGTYGAIKGLDWTEMQQIGYNLMLGNTYHLSATPGAHQIANFGGLHHFVNYNGNLLTDSGGFQMVSLLKLAKICEEGVEFENPKNGEKTMLTPEESIRLQNLIGADIIMALDDVVASVTPDKKRVEEASLRTVRWLDRCIKTHSRPREQNLFAIVQGGMDYNLRKKCLAELVRRDLPGYAIGGLSGGENKEQFWKIVLQCTKALPKNKPRYLMGVGYPLDLVVCSALGCDMFDCVYPSRAARFGTAFTKNGEINLGKAVFRNDFTAIEENCNCSTCKKYCRSFLHSIVSREFVSCSLITMHNFCFIKKLMTDLRESIIENKFRQFVNDFLSEMFLEMEKVPKWVKDALTAVDLEINF